MSHNAMITFLTQGVGTLATICSIVQLSVGTTICKKIITIGSSSEFQFFPFLAMFSSCSVWLKYGLLKEDTALIVVNIFGISLQFSYMVVYYAYTKNRSLVHRQMVLGGMAIFPILVHVRSLLPVDPNLAQSHLGLYCCSMTVISYGAPLAAVAEVLRTKNSGLMSFPLVLANVIVGTEWTFYGFLVKDVYIKVPNAIGTTLGILQMMLFIRYPMKRARVITQTGKLQTV